MRLLRSVLSLFLLVAWSASVGAPTISVERLTTSTPTIMQGDSISLNVLLTDKPTGPYYVMFITTDRATGKLVGVLQSGTISDSQTTAPATTGTNALAAQVQTKPDAPTGTIRIIASPSNASSIGRRDYADVIIKKRP